MEAKIPIGYWIKEESESRLCIGFLYGGHIGGECEIFLPKNKFEKFCEDEEWRLMTESKFYRIVYLGTPELKLPITGPESQRDGVVPDAWD